MTKARRGEREKASPRRRLLAPGGPPASPSPVVAALTKPVPPRWTLAQPWLPVQVSARPAAGPSPAQRGTQPPLLSHGQAFSGHTSQTALEDRGASVTHVLPKPLWGVWPPALGQLLPLLPSCCSACGSRCQASCSRRPIPAPGTVHPGRALLGWDYHPEEVAPGVASWGASVALLGTALSFSKAPACVKVRPGRCELRYIFNTLPAV